MQIVQRALKFNFGTTVALFSGGPQHEKLVGQVINNLRKASNNSVSFVGVTNNQNAQYFDHVYASSNVLNAHDFDRTRGQTEVVSDSILIPYRTPTHLKNNALVKELFRNKLFDDLFTKRVDCFITVGNFSLSKRIYTALDKYCRNSYKLRPPTFLFDQLITQRNVYNEDYLDFIYNRLPRQPENLQKYVFPSMCIGYEGLFRAFQFLQKYKRDPSNDSYWSENFSYDVSQLVRSARQEFRSSRNIKQDNYVIAIAPGETQHQIKFTFKHSLPGINEFLNSSQIKNIGEGFFETFVMLPQDQHAIFHIKAEASRLPSNFKVHFIEPKDKYAALSSADFGILHNGQITVEAAACQLPATVLDSMSNVRAYMENLYNGHVSPLNVSTDYQGYEQLCGSLSVTQQKLAYILTQHFERPKLRFYYAKLYRDHIQAMISKSNTNPELRVSETGLETAGKNIIQISNRYKSMDHNVRKSTNARKQALHFDHH